MKKEIRKKLDSVIADFTYFLEREYSSQFRNLSSKEDRHLFYLARVLTQLKHLSEEIKDEEKIIAFPALVKKS